MFSRTVANDGTISIVDGPGNADEAVTYGLDLSGTFPTTNLGIPGGKLDKDLIDLAERTARTRAICFYVFAAVTVAAQAGFVLVCWGDPPGHSRGRRRARPVRSSSMCPGKRRSGTTRVPPTDF